MRVIAGKAKGRLLKVPGDVSRPTTDRVRESVFGMLSGVVEGARVLDLFAGSGALGVEALSRGASSCEFVESNRGACRVIEENLRKSGLAGGRVRMGDALEFLGRPSFDYDLIFADPPYSDGLADPGAGLAAFERWGELLSVDGLLILETEAMSGPPELKGLEVVKAKRYGRSSVTIFHLAD